MAEEEQTTTNPDLIDVPVPDVEDTADTDKPSSDGKDVDTDAKDDAPSVPDGDLLSDDEGTDQEGVPDQYVFETPEGFDEEAFQAGIAQFMERAKGLGLTQTQFHGLMSDEIERAQAALEARATQVNDWKVATASDKLIGGEKLSESLATAQGVLKKFGDADLMGLMKSPTESNPDGLAIINHPAVLRALVRIGKALADPVPVEGDEAAVETESSLQRFYPTMFDKSA